MAEKRRVDLTGKKSHLRASSNFMPTDGHHQSSRSRKTATPVSLVKDDDVFPL